MNEFGHGELGDEELGRATLRLDRDLAVARALDRMRHALGSDWGMLSLHEMDRLSWLLGELYATLTRAEWEALRFSRLNLPDVRRMLCCATELRGGLVPEEAALEEVVRMIRLDGHGML